MRSPDIVCPRPHAVKAVKGPALALGVGAGGLGLSGALGYLKKSPGLIIGHSPSIALYFAARNATSHSARV
jgi:hypothetical protein